MNNNDQIYAFLQAHGFIVVQKEKSVFFGDYYKVFSNDSFHLRFSCSKSLTTVDIRSNLLKETWYDLALVKALIHGEENLTGTTTIEEYSYFLLQELRFITELFDLKSYPITKEILEELGQKRANQMFPNAKE